MNDWNNLKPTKEYFDELFRVSDFQIIWGANNFTLPETEYFIVWDKAQTVDNFASAEYAWTNVRKPAKIFRYSIHQHNNNKGDKIHPTMKPIPLYSWLLKNYANNGDRILDTHGGSMPLIMAAIELMSIGLHFDITIYEKDPEYFRLAKKKIQAAMVQLPLFTEPPIIEFIEP